MISAVILARNEADNIVECLKAIRPHVAEVILIDMESADTTVELARPYVSKNLSHPVIANFDSARNIAIPEAAFDWLWFVDADERVPEKTGHLVNELVRSRGHEFSAITIPFKSYFCGKWIRHCGWWPGYTMARVLKRPHFRFAERIHGGVEFNGAELRVPPDPELGIDHFSYRSIEQYVEKFNRYTTTEAVNLIHSGQTVDWQTGMRAMMRDLWQYYELNDGKNDGLHGWILSWLAGQYRWFSHAKVFDTQGAREDHQSIPESIDAVIDLMQHELRSLRSMSPQLPLDILWRSPVWDPSGYAEDSRVLLSALALEDRPLAVEELRWSDIRCVLPLAQTATLRALTNARHPEFAAAITSCIPTMCGPDTSATLNVIRTTFETDRIPSDWLPLLDQYNEIWVFSSHDQIAFRRSGVPPEKIRILPSFVDTQQFNARGKKLDLPAATKDRFVFLSVFDWQLRKGWDVLLRAYCEEFAVADGASLLLKITTAHGHTLELIHNQMNAVLESLSQTLEDRQDIVTWSQTLESTEMAGLYRSVDAFVLASRGEGWGRTYMEAMACGLPVIGTRGSGNDDFMTDANSFLVDTELVDVPEYAAQEIPVYRGHRWLEPDTEVLRQKLREVLSDEQKRKQIARRAVRDIRAKFSHQHGALAVRRNLKAAERRYTRESVSVAQQGEVHVELEGEFFASHSFANINEKICLQFKDMDEIDLSIRRVHHNPANDEAVPHAHQLRPYFDRRLESEPVVTIRHAFPPNWTAPAKGRWVHIQPWEFGALPRDWVEPLRAHVDEIWAPSTYVKQAYQRSGISAEKIQVIPWGVDPGVFHPDAPSLFLPTNRSFVFLFVGGTILRKGFDRVLDAYLSEFSDNDDVSLVIKDMGTKTFYRYGNFQQQIIEAQQAPTSPEIIYIDNDVTEGQLASLYTACDCLVAPYRGEGFGLPILEAMACGVAPIVPRGGASDDFTTEESAYFLPAVEVECDHDWRLCGRATELEIDVADVRAAMRYAFEHRDETATKSAEARKVSTHYTWETTAKRMSDRMRHLRDDDSAVFRDTIGADVRAAPTITACMLTRNHETTVSGSLSRLSPFVDEIIVLDAGSTDRTTAIAGEYGARVYLGTYVDDMSVLRNATLRKATSDWILVADGDEFLDDRGMQSIRKMLTELSPDVLGVRIRLQSANKARDDSTAPIRIFRNHNQILYSRRAFEDVGPSIEHLGGRTVLLEDILMVRQEDSVATEVEFRSTAKTLRTLRQDLIEQGKAPLSLLNLGIAHFELGNYFHSECYLSDFLGYNDGSQRERQTAVTMLVESHFRKGDPERAREATERWTAAGIDLGEPVLDHLMPKATFQRLYLGAGQKRLRGYAHVDIASTEGIDVVHDLNCHPWPWDNDSIDVIVAEDVVEHLEIDVVQFCNEAWRVLHAGGELFIRTPHHQGDSSWIDPTHRWHLNEQAFHYLDPETHWGKLYPHYTDRKWRILTLGIRGPQNIHAVLTPRKQR